MIELKDEDIKITGGYSSPKGEYNHSLRIKELQLKQQILKNQEIVDRLRKYIESIDDGTCPTGFDENWYIMMPKFKMILQAILDVSEETREK